jgi:hypothetical protein
MSLKFPLQNNLRNIWQDKHSLLDSSDDCLVNLQIPLHLPANFTPLNQFPHHIPKHNTPRSIQMRLIRRVQIIQPSICTPDLVQILRTRFVQVDVCGLCLRCDGKSCGDLWCEVEDYLIGRGIVVSTGERGHEDGCPACGAHIGYHGREVGFELCDGDVCCGLLVVVSELPPVSTISRIFSSSFPPFSPRTENCSSKFGEIEVLGIPVS